MVKKKQWDDEEIEEVPIVEKVPVVEEAPIIVEKTYTKQEVEKVFGGFVLDNYAKQEYTIAEVKDIALRHRMEDRLILILK
jgi:hypothetical protein